MQLLLKLILAARSLLRNVKGYFDTKFGQVVDIPVHLNQENEGDGDDDTGGEEILEDNAIEAAFRNPV